MTAKPGKDLMERCEATKAGDEKLKRLQSETQQELDALTPSILDRAFKGMLGAE